MGSTPTDTTGFVLPSEWLASHPARPLDVELGEEIRGVLASAGVRVSREDCEQCARVQMTEGKEAAANVLRAVGVKVTCKTQDFNGCKCGTWTVNGHTLFLG